MIEEHVSFHFQQFSSWINRVLMCYFTFLKVEKSGIFFWKPEIRPTLTAQKKYSKVCLGFNFFLMMERHVNFHFQSLLSTIIHVFDILFDFPGGWKIRKILPGFSRSPYCTSMPVEGTAVLAGLCRPTIIGRETGTAIFPQVLTHWVELVEFL